MVEEGVQPVASMNLSMRSLGKTQPRDGEVRQKALRLKDSQEAGQIAMAAVDDVFNFVLGRIENTDITTNATIWKDYLSKKAKIDRFTRTTDLIRRAEFSPGKGGDVMQSLAQEGLIEPEDIDELKEFSEHKEKLRKLQKEKRRRDKKMEEQRKKMEEEWEREQEIQRKVAEQRHQDWIEERERERLAKIERSRLEREERKKQQQLLREREEQWKKNRDEPLYKKIEKRYEKKVLMPELQKRKETLQKIHQQFKPHDFDEMLKRERELKRRAEREAPVAPPRAASHPVNVWKGKSAEMVEAEERQRRVQAIREQEELRAMVNKKKNYAQLVKKMFAPTVDEKKKYELERRKDAIKTKAREPKPLDPDEANFYRKIPKKKPSEQPSSLEDEKSKSPERSPPRRMNPSPRSKKIAQSDRSSGASGISGGSKGMKSKKSHEDRIEALKSRAKEIEGMAMEKERQLMEEGSLGRLEESVEAQSQVSNMYIDAIKTKLALLYEYNQEDTAAAAGKGRK